MTRKLLFILPFIVLILNLMTSSLERDSLIIFMGMWMISWWIFEIAPLGATALIPLVFLPLMGLMPIKEVSPYYSDPMIFLFLGGFILARGLEKTELSERFSLNVLKLTGHSDAGIVAGFIIATAALSMWISNTATAIMMLPIAQSVLRFVEQNTEHEEKAMANLSTVIYLSIAYAANIGGVMTPIGSPPNVLLMGFLENLYQVKIDFWRWIAVMGPVSILLLMLQYFLLNRLFPYKIRITSDFKHYIGRKIKELDPFNHAQILAMAIFCLSCFLWIFKDVINFLIQRKVFDDTSIAILGGCLLFFIPHDLKGFKRILDEKDLPLLPWNIILLFGGGMALAAALEKFGVIQSLMVLFENVPSTDPYMLIFILSAVTLILTEFMSNVALCMIALPLILGLGVTKGIDPVLVGLPAAVCASYAFTLPISTPPNAIVFGSNKIRMKDMLRAGIIMNFLGILSVMTLGWILIKYLF